MNHLRTSLAIVLAAAAVAAPSATALIPHNGGRPADANAYGLITPPDRMDAAAGTSRGESQPIVITPPDRMDAAASTGAQLQPRPIVADGSRVGFDWTAAGVGFAAALGIALLGSGALVTVRWRRQTHTLAH